MSDMIDFAKRCYRFAHRHIHPEAYVDSNPFPTDLWTDSDGYAEWFAQHKTSESEINRQRSAWNAFSIKPVFSFIVPLFKTPREYLHTMADSVLGQTYPRLQLVLVNASPGDVCLRTEVEDYRHRDERVTVVELDGNLGITENTSRGIAAATGDFCCFLDHDDFVEPDLLFEYVQAINEMPEIDVLYCDEDLVARDDATGEFTPRHVLFKPGYSPERLLSKNYVVHLMTIRKSIIDAMPAPDTRFDGSQDYNMLLYATGAARRVYGVQKVLYHWRISENSTATNPESKPYTLRSCRLAIEGEYRRRSIDASIIGTGVYLLHAPWFSRPSASVSVIVCCTGDPLLDTRFVEMFLQNNSVERVELVLVGFGGELPDQADGCALRCVDAAPEGVLSALESGAHQATGDYLVFLDANCFFTTAEPLGQLTGLCALEGVGVAGPKVLYRGNRNKSFGVAVTPERIMPLLRGFEDAHPAYQCKALCLGNVSAVGLQGLCTPRALFEELGGFDESFEGEIGAVDYCKRVRDAGYRVAVTPTVKLEVDEPAPELYYVNEVNAPDYTASDLARFDAKWPGAREAGDPYFNRNLDQSSCYCQIPQE